MSHPEQHFSYYIAIIDKNGNILVSEKDSCIKISSYTQHHVGDEIAFNYEILNLNDGLRRTILRVVKRSAFYVAPRYVPTHKRQPSSPEVEASYNLTCGYQGAFVTLICTPTAKNGGNAGVRRLAEYYKHQRKVAWADRE